MIYAGDTLCLGKSSSVFSVRNAIHSFDQCFVTFWKGLNQLSQALDQAKYSSEAIEHMILEARDSFVQSQIIQQSTVGGNEENLEIHPACFCRQMTSIAYIQDASYVDDLWDALSFDGEWMVGVGVKPTREQVEAKRKPQMI